MSSEAEAQAAAEEVNLFVRLADLEQRYVDLEQNRQELFAQAQAGDERIASLQEEKESFQATILKLKDDLSAANAQLQEEKSSKNEANALATLTQERASRVESEADNLREEIRRCKIKYHRWKSIKSSRNRRQSPLQYEIERFKKEVDVLSAHSKWLEEENARASQELAKTKTQHSQALMDIRQALDQAVMERDESQSELRRLATKKQELESKVEKLSQEYRDSRLEAIAASEASEKELQAERKLVDLQKGQVEQATRRYERLEKELMGLREVAAKASADTDKEFDVIREEIQREANKVLEEQQTMFKKEIEALKKELSAREPMGSPLKSRRLFDNG
ncbi:hypothetical protein MHU86_7640 [Fragilaria crotonensis]|nr:hypothetical protein MHU86_7640 [Fragilaria crotonensis]